MLDLKLKPQSPMYVSGSFIHYSIEAQLPLISFDCSFHTGFRAVSPCLSDLATNPSIGLLVVFQVVVFWVPHHSLTLHLYMRCSWYLQYNQGSLVNKSTSLKSYQILCLHVFDWSLVTCWMIIVMGWQNCRLGQIYWWTTLQFLAGPLCWHLFFKNRNINKAARKERSVILSLLVAGGWDSFPRMNKILKYKLSTISSI